MRRSGRLLAPGRGHRSRGFTLIEVLAAVFLTSIVISVALAFFVDLSRSTEAAAKSTQEGRRAVAVLDRVARDLEGAHLLVKPEATDPLSHPWLFLAEGSGESEGADRLKFTSRSYRARTPTAHGSDVAVITYILREGEDGAGYVLLRSIVPGLPEQLDREFPSEDDERFMAVAEGLSSFALRFLGESGEWQDQWDSSLIEESSALPRAVEIELSILASEPEELLAFADFTRGAEGDELPTYTRRVSIPMKAIDLEAMLASAREDEGDPTVDEDSGGEEPEEGEDGEGGVNDPTTGQRIPSTGNDPILDGPPRAGDLGPEFGEH